jgi:hypothetical protein
LPGNDNLPRFLESAASYGPMLPIAQLIKIKTVSKKFRFIKEILVTFRAGRK